METLEIKAVYEKDTKRTHKYQANALGYSIGIYIDKMAEIPEKIVLILKDKKETK